MMNLRIGWLERGTPQVVVKWIDTVNRTVTLEINLAVETDDGRYPVVRCVGTPTVKVGDVMNLTDMGAFLYLSDEEMEKTKP